MLYPDFHNSYLMCCFWPRTPSGHHITLSCLLRQLLALSVSLTFLGSDDVDNFKKSTSPFCTMLFYWNFCDVFCTTRLGLQVFRRKTAETESHIHDIMSRHTPSTRLTTVDTNFNHQLEQSAFFPEKLLFFCFPYSTLWEEVTVPNTHLRNGELCARSSSVLVSLGYVTKYYKW